MMKEITGILLDTKRFAVHDGPGIRTAFFTKGCPLKCLWCHNPESISKLPEMGFYPHLCRQCGKCAALCPADAHLTEQGGHIFKKEVCLTCGQCETECPGNAMKLYGKEVSVAEAFALALEDRDFYEESGGGVTVSGGEPLLQKEFVFELFKALKAEGIHTALDTCAFVSQSALAEMLSVTDLFLVDFKHADSFKHRQLTGVPNEVIKSNLKFLSDSGVFIEIRIPFVPGCNSDAENMEASGAFLGQLNVGKVKLLPYHALARNKYAALQMEDTMPRAETPSEKEMAQALDILKKYGLDVHSGRE